MYKSIRILLSALVLLTLLMGVAPISNVHAATTTVTTNADSGAGSLRQAIASATDGDTINFNASLSGQTIPLGSTLSLNKNLTIDGSSLASHIKISGSGSYTVFTVNSGKTVTLNHLDIINGASAFTGGGIQNSGTLTVTNSTLSGNSAGTDGGGIYNDGTVTITSSTFSGNSASSSGGISNHNGILTVTNSIFSTNSASNNAGGIYNQGTGTVTNSTFSGNSAGFGGGIENFGGSLTLTNSTLSSNTATSSGGGIENTGTLTVANSALSANSATTNGGGIYNIGTLTVTNSTLSANSATTNGGGIFNASGKTLNYANTIISNSTSGGDCVNNGGLIGTNTNNLVEDNSCSPAYSGDPLLGPLANNGGPTQTFALLGGSLAIDAGNDTICVAVPVNNLDQRGVTRPQGIQCDIGAYEYAPVIYYVKWNAAGTNNGTSWTNAFTSLQSAITAAAGGDQIWVAAGIYIPHASDRTVSFTFENGVAIYGGFNGTETLLNQRNPSTNFTILSGDLNGNDSGFTNNDENSYHVLAGGGTNKTAILDGFTVKGGNANGGGSADFGGGMYNSSSSPTLTNVTFSGNSASLYGGGVYNFTSSPTLMNVIFSNNPAVSNGGGMFNQNSSPTMTNVTFSSNSATNGGGVFSQSSSPILRSVTFSGNSASSGGGMYNLSSSPTLTSVIIANSSSGGDCANNSSTLNAASANNLIEDVVNTCGLTNGVNGNIIGSDPKLGPLANNGGSTQTFALLAGSPAIEAGKDGIGVCPATDQRGVTRPSGLHCDIGAYEAELLTVTADSKTITYGSPDPTFTFQYSGFTNGDTSSVVDTPPTCSVSGAHTNVGSYPIVCSGGVDNKYGFVYVNGTLTINKATPTLSVTNSPVAYDGSPHSATVTGSVPGTVSNILAGGSATQTNVGTYAVTANFTPTDTTNYNTLTNASAGNFTITLYHIDTTGVFRPSNGLLYLKNTNATGFADVSINYGTGGDYPVTGDWDGNGTATIGIYRNASFYLRNSNTLGFADLVFQFGQPGDQPVTGDWDGNGIDTIGVYRPSTGQFLLRDSNSAGAADYSFYLGNVGDVGIAGDWTNKGFDTVGVFRPSNGILFLKNTNQTGFADIALNYGLAGDQPVVGDWDGNGTDTIGVYRNAQFLLRNSNTIGFADIAFYLGNPGDMPIAGDWDGLP